LLSQLRPLAQGELEELLRRWPRLPNEYVQFLRERGAGPIEDGFQFDFLSQPLDACSEVFKDREILERGAKGDVIVFGHDQSESSFGFDLGDANAIVQIDASRLVSRVPGSFAQFVEQLITKYPQVPK